jgi:hypothetical protein
MNFNYTVSHSLGCWFRRHLDLVKGQQSRTGEIMNWLLELIEPVITAMTELFGKFSGEAKFGYVFYMDGKTFFGTVENERDRHARVINSRYRILRPWQLEPNPRLYFCAPRYWVRNGWRFHRMGGEPIGFGYLRREITGAYKPIFIAPMTELAQADKTPGLSVQSALA